MADAWRGFTRRYRRFSLRLQGRLDGEWADRYLPWTAAIAVFTVLLLLELAAVRSQTSGSGLAPWLQAAWRRSHGGAGAPMGRVDPATGSGALIAEPVLLVARAVPAEVVFAVVQAAAIGLAMVPLWWLARHECDLRVGASFVILVVFATAPALHRTNLSAFHPEVVALPALLAAYVASRRQRWVAYGVLVGVVLLCRGDLGITVAALGGLLLLDGRRRPAVITIVVGVVWTAGALVVVDPTVPAAALTPADEFVARQTVPLAMVREVFTDPIGSVGDLLSEPSVTFLVLVLAPLLFLPLVRPRRVMAAVPCIALAVLADRAIQRAAERLVLDLSPVGAHIAPAMAFLFIATAYALARIGRRSVTRVNVDPNLVIALLVGGLLLFVVEAPTSPYRTPWRWGGVSAVGQARERAVDEVGPSVPAAVSPEVSALVAERARVVELAPAPDDVGSVPDGVNRVILDTTATDADGEPRWPTFQRRVVLDRLAEGGFRVTSRDLGIYVLQR